MESSATSPSARTIPTPHEVTYFDDCLAAPTAQTLIECTVGLLDYQPENPPPVGYVPAFVTDECVSLDAACP